MIRSTSLRLMAGTYRLRTTCPSGTRSASVRNLHRTTVKSYPRKDSQHKDSINTEATEYSKSGTDDQAAREEEAAFDPQQTSPEKQRETAGKDSGAGGNPLDVSPANPEVSKQRDDTKDGPSNSSASAGTMSGRKRASGGGSPQKNQKGQ
ncbi:MAG: hypothetical protein M1812_006881 [Candelaria pacifica]|nr:MAG: hypothetical protein M1812_006881 [Candelaria pacifica]